MIWMATCIGLVPLLLLLTYNPGRPAEAGTLVLRALHTATVLLIVGLIYIIKRPRLKR